MNTIHCHCKYCSPDPRETARAEAETRLVAYQETRRLRRFVWLSIQVAFWLLAAGLVPLVAPWLYRVMFP